MGSFYPFSRDHSAIGTKPQELYLWESVAENARNSLKLRYALLPYWYTLFYHSHISGTPVVKPLVFEFGDDVATHKIDKQFLLGSSILVRLRM